MSPQNPVSYSGLTSKPTPGRNKCSFLKGHRSDDSTEVHPDRTPLVGWQPLIGQWWCHHPKECVEGLSCSRDRGFMSFPCNDPLTSTFGSYIYLQPQCCLQIVKLAMLWVFISPRLKMCNLTSLCFTWKLWTHCADKSLVSLEYSVFQTHFMELSHKDVYLSIKWALSCILTAEHFWWLHIAVGRRETSGLKSF